MTRRLPRRAVDPVRSAKARAGQARSRLLTLLLLEQLRGLPKPQLEFMFHVERKWRFDLAWPGEWLAVEIQGGVFAGGRHVHPARIRDEYEKLGEAAMLGWRVIPVLPEWVENGSAEVRIRRCFSPLLRVR